MRHLITSKNVQKSVYMESAFMYYQGLPYFWQALNGFLMILDCNGELFFATHTIETYLGFHQSDVIHQVTTIPYSKCTLL